MPSFTTALKSLTELTRNQGSSILSRNPLRVVNRVYFRLRMEKEKIYEKLHPNTFVQERRCFGNPRASRSSFSPSNNGIPLGSIGQVNPQGSMAFHGIPLRPGAVGQIRPVRPRPFPPRKSGRPPVSRDPRDPLQKVSKYIPGKKE